MEQLAPSVDTPGERLLADVLRNALVSECLARLPSLTLPNWYLGAGCLAQSVWNCAHSRPAAADIVDYDIVYFDDDLSERSEDEAADSVRELLADLPVKVDVKNQARVHLWYASRFGYAIQPYTSCEDAISTWPTTATAVGVRRLEDARFLIQAPFGVDDLLALKVRPNRVQITPAIYAAKVERWRSAWPRLRIFPWEDGVGEPGLRRVVLEGP
jgi:hypothetical protein